MARVRPNPRIFHDPTVGLHTRGFDVALVRLRTPFNKLRLGHFATREDFLRYAKAVRSRNTAKILSALRDARRAAEAHREPAGVLADINEVRREFLSKGSR